MSDQTVSWWLKGERDGRPVKLPSEYCPLFERRTRERGEPVLCEELCPTVDWAILRMQAGTGPWDGAERRAA